MCLYGNPASLQIASLSIPIPPLPLKLISGCRTSVRRLRTVVRALYLLGERHSAHLLVRRPVLALALGPAVEDELARTSEVAAWLVAGGAELGVLQEICHAPGLGPRLWLYDTKQWHWDDTRTGYCSIGQLLLVQHTEMIALLEAGLDLGCLDPG
jgi:hypothetical protein